MNEKKKNEKQAGERERARNRRKEGCPIANLHNSKRRIKKIFHLVFVYLISKIDINLA